jgi:hypothetical protein
MKEREKESCRDVGWKERESGGKVNCNERKRNASFFTILPSLLFSLFFVLFSGFFSSRQETIQMIKVCQTGCIFYLEDWVQLQINTK